MATSIILSGCAQYASSINGSGKIIDQDVKMADFDNLDIQGINVEIVQSGAYQVTLSTDENLISRIKFTQNGKTLIIRIEAQATFFPTSLKVRIAMPEITGLNLSGKVKATISGFKNLASFDLVLTDASLLTGDLEANFTNFNLSKASQINLQGKSKQLTLESSGASKLDLANFILGEADVKLREASLATFYVNGEFDVSLRDSSKIIYLGNPLITDTSISEDSSMIHQ